MNEKYYVINFETYNKKYLYCKVIK